MKRKFLKQWSPLTSVFSKDGRDWIRCQPIREAGIRHPHLHSPGATKWWVRPDCMYMRVATSDDEGDLEYAYADVIAFEVCSSRQNIEEKRGKYSVSDGSFLVNISNEWLAMPLYESGPKSVGSYIFGEAHEDWKDYEEIVVRTLRVLYIINTKSIDAGLIYNLAPRAWEYFYSRHVSRFIDLRSI